MKKRVRPLLAIMSKRLSDLGKQIDLATVVTVAAMVLVASTIESIGEMTTLVEAYGIDRERFLHLLAQSPLFGRTTFEEHARRIGPRAFGDARFSVSSGLKEVEMAIQL